MVSCNTTLEDAYIIEDPLWHSVTWHHIGLFIAAIFGLISIIISLFLIYQHATHYLRPDEQRHIIRILFMIPVYSLVSFLSYMFYRKAVYFEVLRDCYEAFCISSFFALMCHYIAPNLHDQKEYFRTVKPVNWFWKFSGLQYCTGGEDKGILRKPRSGLTWFNVIWVGIYQYCFIRVFFTIVSVISEVFDRYCTASLDPRFAHIWVLVFESLSVTVAMFMVVQFYIQLKDDLVEHKPFLKVLSIKLVIFFSFWQSIVISFLASDSGPLKPTKTLAYQDIKIGIPSVMLCIAMAAFSVMHMFAYPWKPYRIEQNNDPLVTSGAGFSGGLPTYKGGPFGLKALVDAFNPWDIVKASARGFRWMVVGAKRRHADTSYLPASAKFGDQETGYMRPAFAGTGEAATELNGARRGRADTYAAEEDDRAGLLGHSAAPASSPYAPQQQTVRGPAGYDPVIGGDGTLGVTQPPRAADPYPVHGGEPGAVPANSNWNHWAGLQMHGEDDDDAQSLGRPPTYRTNDARG